MSTSSQEKIKTIDVRDKISAEDSIKDPSPKINPTIKAVISESKTDLTKVFTDLIDRVSLKMMNPIAVESIGYSTGAISIEPIIIAGEFIISPKLAIATDKTTIR